MPRTYSSGLTTENLFRKNQVFFISFGYLRQWYSLTAETLFLKMI